MSRHLYVDPHRRRGPLHRAVQWLLATPPMTRNPAWFHNLRADPDVRLGGVELQAGVVSDATERQRLRSLEDLVSPAFAVHRAQVTREIPTVAQSPRR